jgi:hypothetical protein
MRSNPLGNIFAWDKLARNMVLSSNEPKFLEETCKHEANRLKFPMETQNMVSQHMGSNSLGKLDSLKQMGPISSRNFLRSLGPICPEEV